MPIMAPLVEVPRQVAVLAYQLGFKSLWPIATIAAMCGVSKVPLTDGINYLLFGICSYDNIPINCCCNKLWSFLNPAE